jgi:hypothetical protein
MRALTASNLPDPTTGLYRRLGIVLDGKLLSAPRLMSTITDRGQVTGNFTPAEVDLIVAVLRAGKLPVPLEEQPVAESPVAADPAARRTIVWTLAISLGLVSSIWLMMVVRFRLVGLGGALTNLLQLLLVLTAILLLGIVVELPVVTSTGAMLLLGALGNVLICSTTHRSSQRSKADQPIRWRALVLASTFLSAGFFMLLVVSSAAYALGEFVIRNAAVGVMFGSAAALLSSCLCLPLLAAVLQACPTRRAHPPP